MPDLPSKEQALDLRQYRYLSTLLTFFVAILLISNVMGQKLCLIWGFSIGGANLLFPVTYIFGDVFTEVYGYAASRRAIWLGFLCSFLMSAIGLILVALPPHPEWKNQEAYAAIFGFVPKMVGASLIAYWCGEFANSYTMARMKVFTSGKHLWMRTIGSTVVGQLVDTTVFLSLAFSSTLTLSSLIELIITSYSFKVIYEICATPLTYWVVNTLKRAEGVDSYDYNTDFNPFHKALGN
ncbi:transporter [Bryobacterales bacterium F-183]|nr:transporter [Bryobacterales bacterium F-183]